MINVPLQDDIYAHKLLFELLCLLYELLFDKDLWTFNLKIRKELKHFLFFSQQGFKKNNKRSMEGDRWLTLAWN